MIVSGQALILPSLLTDNFQGKLNGFQDILTLIAREFMFEFRKMDKTEYKRDICDDCIYALQLWCGFDDEAELKELREKPVIKEWLGYYPYADGYLKNYYDKFIVNPKSKNKKNKNVSWEYYAEYWKKRLLDTESHLYSAKSFCYENIIADAVAEGPLNNYCLVFKGSEKIFKKSLNNSAGKNPTDPTFQKNCKLISAYLLGKKRAEDQETVYLRKLRLLNWLGYDSDKRSNWFPGLLWQGQPVCERISKDDFVKVKINQDFIDAFELKLIKEDEIKNYKSPEYSVLKDCGHKAYLKQINQ